MTNPEIADAFDSVADILEFQGANPFRVRAYRNAARTIRDLPESMAEIVADPSRKLTDIEGIGKDLAEKIAALVATGKLEMLEELKQQVPESVLSMMRVPGLGPKRAAMLFKELKVATLEELRRPARPTRSASSRALGPRPKSRFWPACNSPPRPTSGSCGPRPTTSCRKSWRTCVAARPSSRSKRRAAIAAAAKPSATWTSWPSPATPRP